MKKTLTTLALVAVCAGAIAQGKINMVNDSNHLVVWGSDLKAAQAGLSGTAADGLTASGQLLIIDLFGATTAGGPMVLQQSTTLSTGGLPGFFGPKTFISPNLPGGVQAFMQVQVREATFATAALAQQGGGYYGFSPVFTFNPSATIAYNSIVVTGGTALSTWANGSILVNAVVPEPSSMALAGLGAASLLIFRRRK